MGKYDRMHKRKLERKAEREKERQAKEDKKVEKKKPKTWRKDKGGNYIYKNAIRFSILSLVAMFLVVGFISVIAITWLSEWGIIDLCDFMPCAEAEHNPDAIQYIAIIPPDFVGSPTIEELMPFDTSDERVSGFFLQDENGSWYRDDPRYEKHWNWYYPYFLGQTVVFVDPPLSPHLREGVHVLEIKMHETVKCCFSSQVVNGTTTHIEKRFINEGCSEAVIELKDWEVLLADTITYMGNHCDGHLNDLNRAITDLEDEITDLKAQKSTKLWELRQTEISEDRDVSEEKTEIELEYDEQIIALEEQIVEKELLLEDEISFTEIETEVLTYHEKTETYKVPRTYIHEIKMVKLGEWCADKYPCVYVWDEYDWVKQVKEWYDSDLITHDTFDIFLAYCYDHKIISEIPPHN